MSITSTAGIIAQRIWHPYRVLIFLSCWLLLVMLIAFSLGSCNGSPTTNASISLSCPQDSGAIGLSWSITRNGQPSSCAEVGAHSVALRLKNRATGAPTFTAFPCTDNSAFAMVPAGLYDVAIELHDDQGARIAAATDQRSVPVVAGHVRSLQPITFDVGGGTTTGGIFALMLSAPPFSSNCRPAVSGGAAISNVSIALETAAGACVPVTWIRSIGDTEVAVYPVGCGTTAITTCIENNERVVPANLPAGVYSVHVRGSLSVNPDECWVNDSTFEVPADGSPPATKTLNLALQDHGC
jgi:hypothetical protein